MAPSRGCYVGWPWSPLSWEEAPWDGSAGGWIQTHHRGPAEPHQAPAPLGSSQVGSCLALAAWEWWWRRRIRLFWFSRGMQSISSTAFKQPPYVIPPGTVFLLKNKLRLIQKMWYEWQCKAYFLSQKKKTQPTVQVVSLYSRAKPVYHWHSWIQKSLPQIFFFLTEILLLPLFLNS